jgi:putative colanic acid biosynthesis acetyltransferase WcaF
MTTTNQVHPPPTRRSVWTFKQKVVRLLWGTAGRALWVCAARFRPWLIRRFGGRVGPGCRFARSVDIIIPWNLRVGSNVEVGRGVILYTLGVITLGDGVVIDDLAHLCAGTHDFTDSRFPLLTPPITIGPGTFIGIDAYIAPGVTLGAGCRVWPRASVYRSFGDGAHIKGNPGRPVPPEEEAA